MQTLLLIVLIGYSSMRKEFVRDRLVFISLLFNFSENHFVRFHLKFLALIMVELP